MIRDGDCFAFGEGLLQYASIGIRRLFKVMAGCGGAVAASIFQVVLPAFVTANDLHGLTIHPGQLPSAACANV